MNFALHSCGGPHAKVPSYSLFIRTGTGLQRTAWQLPLCDLACPRRCGDPLWRLHCTFLKDRSKILGAKKYPGGDEFNSTSIIDRY